MSIVPLQHFRIDGFYVVNLESADHLESGVNSATLLPQWLFQKLIGDDWTCLQVNSGKAKETAGDAIIGYESYMVHAMSYISGIVDRRGYCPSDIAVQDHTRAKVSNKAFYRLPLSRKLAVHVNIIADIPGYAVRLGDDRYICIGKFFGDMVERLVFDIFEDMRENDWYNIPSAHMREALMDAQILTEGLHLEQDLNTFAAWIPKVSLRMDEDRRRSKILRDFGMIGMKRRETVFLDFVLADNDDE